jgi:hypothetical protein
MERMTTTTYAAEAAERGTLMGSSTIIQSEVREFAREFPTPNVQRALALCENGTLEWEQVHDLFKRSLVKGLAATAA